MPLSDSSATGTGTGTGSMWLAAGALLIAMLGTTLPTPLYALYQQQLDFGPTWTTLIFSIYAGGVITALLVAGSWSDQLGRKPILLAGLLMGAVSAVIFLGAHSIGALLWGRLFSGFSAGIMTGTATVAIIELAPSGWSRHATLVATAANMLGLGLGPPVAGLTSQFLPEPLRMAFYLHLMLLILAAFGVMLVRETVRRPERVRLTLQRPAIPPSVRPWFVPAAIAGLAGFSVAGLFTSMVPSVMRQIMGETDGLVIGTTISLLFVSSIGGQALLQLLPARSHMTVGCLALVLGMVDLGLSVYTGHLTLLVLAGICAGIGQGMVFRAGMAAVTAAAPPDQKAAVASALFVMFYFSMSLPVIAVGCTVPLFGLDHVGEFFASLVAVVALVAMFSMKRIQRNQATNEVKQA